MTGISRNSRESRKMLRREQWYEGKEKKRSALNTKIKVESISSIEESTRLKKKYLGINKF